MSTVPSPQEPTRTQTPAAELSGALRRRLPAGTVAWGVLQPNAVGRGEWRGRAAFTQRQLLKAANLCPAERMFVALGADELAMWHAIPGRILGGLIGRWDLADVVAVPVEPVGVADPWWPALRLSVRRTGPDGRRRTVPVAEARAVRDEPRVRALVAMLLDR